MSDNQITENGVLSIAHFITKQGKQLLRLSLNFMLNDIGKKIQIIFKKNDFFNFFLIKNIFFIFFIN